MGQLISKQRSARRSDRQQADEAKVNKHIVAVMTANSNCGLHAIRHLIMHFNDKVTIRAIIRDEKKAEALKEFKENIEIVSGVDATNKESLLKAFRGATKAFIIPPNAQNRADLVCAMVDGAKDSGVQHVAIVSVYGAMTEKTMFHKQFRHMEKHLEASGLSYTFLRSVVFYDNLLGSADTIKSKGEFYGCMDDAKYPTIAVDDVGKSAAFVLGTEGNQHLNKAYDMTGPESLSQAEVAGQMSKALGYEVRYVNLSDEEMRKALEPVFEEWQVTGFLELLFWYRDGNAVVSKDVKEITGTNTTVYDWTRAHMSAFVR